MKQEISDETIDASVQLITAIGASPLFHITQVRICDCCGDDDKESFPYGVKDRGGKWWHDLCNECFDNLGCTYADDNGGDQ